ncbi:unnamed protein product [Choristocarpus tenellus]
MMKITASAVFHGLLLSTSSFFGAESLSPRMPQTPYKQGRQDPAAWLVKGAKRWSDSFGEGGGMPLFRLDVNEFEKAAGVGSAIVTLPTSDQNVFQWSSAFAMAISCGQSISFSIDAEEFTATRSGGIDYNLECDLERRKYFWTGIIGDSGGDLTCSFSWGTLDVTIRVTNDDVDSFYQVTMVESDFTIKRTLKSDLPESNSSGVRRVLANVEPRPTEERHLLDTTVEAALGTDLLVFYTESAAISVGGSEVLEAQIQDKVDEFNVAVDAANYPHLRINLVSVFGIFSMDYSTWITPDCEPAQLEIFGENSTFTDRRDLIGADAMMLVHDWSGDYCGWASIKGSDTIVRSDCFIRHTFQHELGHNFGLVHNNGMEFTTYRTIMAIASVPRRNVFSATSLGILRGDSAFEMWNGRESNGEEAAKGRSVCRNNIVLSLRYLC